MAEFRNVFVNFVLVGIVITGLLSFGILLQLNNNASETLLDDPSLNKLNSSIYSNVSNARTGASGQLESQQGETPTEGTDSLLFFTIVEAPKVFINSITGVFGAIGRTAETELGIPRLVLAGLSAILLGSLVLLVWQLIRSGR